MSSIRFSVRCMFRLEKSGNRGGKNTKVQSAVALLKGIKLKGKTILADKAYSSEHICVFIAEHGAVVCIPDKSNLKVKHDFDAEVYKHRNIVERFFQRIKNYRHIATRRLPLGAVGKLR